MQDTSQVGLQQESTLLETLFTSGLSHLNTSFKDVFFEEHIASLTSVSPEWILFDSGAAAHCCPKNFAREWPLLPLQDRAPPLRSVTGQLLNIYGRRLVGMKIGDVEFHMHFYVTDIPYLIVSVGRLLALAWTSQSATTARFLSLRRHAQFLLNNFSVRTDGQTPYERRWTLGSQVHFCGLSLR